MKVFRTAVILLLIAFLFTHLTSVITEAKPKAERTSRTKQEPPLRLETVEVRLEELHKLSLEEKIQRTPQSEDHVLDRLKKPEQLKKEQIMTGAFSDMRLRAIRDAALTMAAQVGLHWRYQQINHTLENIASTMDATFNFRPFLLSDGRVLPPSIAEAEGGMTIRDDEAILTGTTWKILRDARMVSTSPDWRQYLIRHELGEKDVRVNPSLMPKDQIERGIWEKAVQDGWQSGIHQAERIFQIALARLKREYLGIIRFHMLAEHNIVSIPYLAEGDMGVHVQGRHLAVGQRQFRITRPARFKGVNQWKPIVGTAQSPR